MGASLPVERQADGQLVAVKHVADPAGRKRLAREAELLRRAEHPNVVRLVAAEDDELRTRFVTATTAADLTPGDAAAAVAVAIALAAAVDELHRAGVAHNRIAGDHVLIGTAGEPVLCGFADAVLRAHADDAAWRAAQQRDVAGVGAVLEELLDRAPRPSGLRRRPGTARLLDQARLVARQATDPKPSARPPAGVLAARLAAAAPAARLAQPPLPIESPEPGAATALDQPTRRVAEAEPAAPAAAAQVGRAPRLVAVFAGLAVLGVAVGWALAPDRRGEPAPVELTLDPTGDDPSPARPSQDAPVAAQPVVSGAIPTLTVDGQTFEVGLPGDVVTIGDFDCDGAPTAGLLRPSTGEVFVFRGWAGAGAEVSAAALGRAPGALGLRVEEVDGCEVLAALDAGGAVVARFGDRSQP